MVETASKEVSQTSGGVSGCSGREETEQSTFWSHKTSRAAEGTGVGSHLCLPTLFLLTSSSAISLVSVPAWELKVGVGDVGVSWGRP